MDERHCVLIKIGNKSVEFSVLIYEGRITGKRNLPYP